VSEIAPALAQIAVLVIALAIAVPLLGRYLAHVYTSPKHLAVERASYRVLRVDPDADQHWRTYAMSVLGFSLVGVLLLFGLGQLQEHLPLSLRSGTDVRLTRTEWAFPELLARNVGRLVSREQVLREVWGPAYEHESHYMRVYAA
jgi:K+-transporting ATPase A subunit